MQINTFIATPGRGIDRASRQSEDTWTTEHLLQDEEVRCLATTPTHANVIYAGTNGNGVLRSDDGGQTWQSNGLSDWIVTALAVSRSQPETVLAACKPLHLFVSHDSGASWTELPAFREKKQWWWFTPAETPPTQPYALGLVISPTDPDLIIAGIEYGAVLRSDDGGQTWTGHQPGALRDCHMLVYHATDGNWVYQGGGGGAAVSSDAGQTWKQPHPVRPLEMIKRLVARGQFQKPYGLEHHYGWAVGADPAQPDIWYCATAPGPQKAHGNKGNAEASIYRSRHGGNWERLAGGLPQPLAYMPYALITDEQAPGHLYAGLSNGDIWHSSDHGDSWRQLPINLRGIHRSLLGFHYQGPQ